MSYRHTLDAALESLHEIETLMKEFPVDGNIPTIDIDLALQKIRNLYELLLMMKGLQENFTEKDPLQITDTTANQKKKSIARHTEADKPRPIQPPERGKAGKEPEVLSERFEGKETLYESLHQSFSNQGETLGNTKPVSDILTAIALNDRFTFVRELFDNNIPLFESTIKKLNGVASYNEACDYLNRHFTWDMESEVAQQLLEVIRRKYNITRHE